MSESTTFIGIRISQTLRKEAEKTAAQERRTLSNMVRILLEEALRARNGKAK